MALETLRGIKKIGEFDVYETGSGRVDGVRSFIVVNHHDNTIHFKIQKGAIKEKGKNGCQVDALIVAAKLILEGLNEKFPCKENKDAIRSLGDALIALTLRKINRTERGVEGFEKL